MTAPIWVAAPPEVHSTLLSSGPGPGSLLAAAQAWTALSTEYTEAADELIAVLAGVQAGTWEGPSVESYAAAHAPYLAWLQQESANSAARAAEHQTAAAAYTAAVAAMPTLGELAANHATHAVLLGTNFLGINTIPIALNEADYARMWVQAATVMSTYEGVAGASVAAAPTTQPAPTIVKSAAAVDATPTAPPQWFEDLQSYLEGLFPQPPYPNPSQFPLYQQLLDFFNQIGFTGVNDPIATWLQGLDPSWLPPVGVPGSWLAFTGDPLAYLNPASIAYVLSVPLDPGSYFAFTGIVIVDDLLAIVYTAAVNPQALILVIPAALVEIVGSTIGNTIQVLHYILDSTLALAAPGPPAACDRLAGSPGGRTGRPGRPGGLGGAGRAGAGHGRTHAGAGVRDGPHSATARARTPGAHARPGGGGPRPGHSARASSPAHAGRATGGDDAGIHVHGRRSGPGRSASRPSQQAGQEDSCARQCRNSRGCKGSRRTAAGAAAKAGENRDDRPRLRVHGPGAGADRGRLGSRFRNCWLRR